MDIFTEYVRRLLSEINPYLKWAHRNWPTVAILLVAALLLLRFRKRRKW
jgi:hypothetical protein